MKKDGGGLHTREREGPTTEEMTERDRESNGLCVTFQWTWAQ